MRGPTGALVVLTTEHCKCDKKCEMPCWQRVGVAPPCIRCGCNQ